MSEENRGFSKVEFELSKSSSFTVFRFDHPIENKLFKACNLILGIVKILKDVSLDISFNYYYSFSFITHLLLEIGCSILECFVRAF